MGQVTCSICGRTCNDEIAWLPECSDCVCDECGTLYEGYCESCFGMVADSFE